MALSQWARQGRSESLSETVLGFVILGAALFVAVKSENLVNPLQNSAAGSLANSNPTTITALRRAIIGQESAGNFQAVNPHSGALGYGQVMPENVASWTKAALGKELSQNEFLNNREAQIKTIDYKLGKYYAEELKAAGGDEAIAVRRVASVWYSGQGDWWNDPKAQYYNGHRYPSIGEYTASILEKYRQEKGE